MDAKLAESKAAIGIFENTKADGVGESSLASGSKESSATAAATAEYNDLEVPARLTSVPEQILRRTGYTVSYNSERRVPNWVAWCLTAERLTGNSKRSDAKFHEDTDVPEPRAVDFDYVRSGYDRGHMCPAGDNKWSAQTMDESFLFTNICPQAPQLNRGDWNEMEQACRKWAKQDGALYIVCGPMFYKNSKKTIGKNRVAVPDAFFKVVLCMTGEPKAIGFIYKNGDGNRPKGDYANSVDEVERITGIDFFPALPDDIENKVEATCNPDDWNI
ncbi:DNA/RNA non-specific endonuclease [Leyella stercorea]|uniref:DNA/RNA non-specific endonuclease n=1 Tax=Leyella stercorea TaxID=363265 RepID=UPI002432D865|nr:DNA/RNA non-specific endonuclease [Leyella stercorea]